MGAISTLCTPCNFIPFTPLTPRLIHKKQHDYMNKTFIFITQDALYENKYFLNCILENRDLEDENDTSLHLTLKFSVSV